MLTASFSHIARLLLMFQVQMSMQQRILGFGAFILQYVVAVVRHFDGGPFVTTLLLIKKEDARTG